MNTNPEVVRALIAAGANLDSRTNDGATALILASGANGTETVKILIAAGAGIDAVAMWGRTALIQAAARNPNPEVIEALLDAGADGNIKSSEGKIAFDYAKDNDAIKGTDAYWMLNDARF